jgi:hypothetical protein
MRRGVATPRLSKPPPINERDDERRGNAPRKHSPHARPKSNKSVSNGIRQRSDFYILN